MMKASEFVAIAKKAATECKTLYVMGCFGAPMTATNKKRYTSNNPYNKKENRVAMINSASADTFGFDCVCFIKGILWGWNANTTKQYGGATYASNGIPDVGADDIMKYCTNVSTDFSKMEIGEIVHMSGHVGIYIGDGLAIECTPAWKNKVQITAVKNIGSKTGYNARTWVNHGKLNYIEYDKINITASPITKISIPNGKGCFKKGDKGDAIEKIDEWLYQRYNDSKIKGAYFGPYTEKYVKKFQEEARANGTYVGKSATIDGKIGPLTLNAMRIAGFKY